MNNEKKAKKNEVICKIILFVVGVIIGAAISTVAFFVYLQNSNSATQQMPGGMPPEMMNKQNGQDQPPERPNEQTNQNQSSEKTDNNTNNQTSSDQS